jgi:hypothetical protein
MDTTPKRIQLRRLIRLKRQPVWSLLTSCILGAATLGLPGATGPAQSGAIFGPEIFSRSSAAKDIFARTFAVSDATIPYTVTRCV